MSMDQNKPLVSVLMPAYNVEKYIEVAVRSILDQTYCNFELIIIDDCSTDGTWQLILELARQDSRIRPFRNSANVHISATLNKAIAIAEGKYFARMDADDWSFSNRIEKQVVFMESHPEVGICGAAMEVCDNALVKKNLRVYNLHDLEIRQKIFFYSPFCHPVVMMRASVIKENFLSYNETFIVAEDYDLYFRIGKYSSFANLEDVLIKYRTSDKPSSLVKAKKQEIFTLYIRLKAVFEYGYKMNFVAKLYFVGQLMSLLLVPASLKYRLFNYWRGLK
jgi:glycosyltransferase involved in cell wall biosynthesis